MFDPGQATPTATDVANALRAADEANARAVTLLMRAGPDALARETAMPAEMALSVLSGRPRWEVHQLLEVAQTLAHLPRTRALLASGEIGYAQARAICFEVRALTVDARAALDVRIADLVRRLADAEPEALIDHVAHEVATARPDLTQRREDRRIAANHLAISPYLDGSGGSLVGRLDAESLTTLTTALDAEAETPDPDERGRQRAEALVRIAERSLAGADGADGARPRARMLLTYDISDAGARAHWSLPGRPARLSLLATEVLACDADVTTIALDAERPIAVSDSRALPTKVRSAVIARDGGCRAPGCSAPVAWCDVHHINTRAGHHLSNLVLLCRRCHRRMHRRPWRIRHQADGQIAFAHRGRTHTSAPRARPLRT